MSGARVAQYLLFFTLALLSFDSALADQSPLLKAIEADQASFEAHAKADDRVTLAEYYDANRPTKLNAEKLTRLIERAQTAWVSGAIDQARTVFREIAALTYEDDWQEAHRETIAYAMLRLAQSAGSPLEASEWVEKVARSFPSFRPDEDLFPPPLVATFRETQGRLRSLAKDVHLESAFRDYRFVLINGQKYRPQLKKTVRLAPGTYRITAFSDSRAPVFEKMTVQQLETYRAASPPLVIGNCQAPQFFRVPQVEGTISAYFGDRCIRTRDGQNKALTDFTTLTNTPNLPLPTEPRRFLGLSKSSWVVVGITTVVVSAAIALDRATKTTVEPTVRNGF